VRWLKVFGFGRVGERNAGFAKFMEQNACGNVKKNKNIHLKVKYYIIFANIYCK